MSSQVLQIFARSNLSRSVLTLGGALSFAGALSVAGATYFTTYQPSRTQMLSLETEFGTSDGYFPTATKGALLSNPPGNKNHIVGERYVALSQRKSSERRDLDQKYRHN